ncbi:MAG: hypothetical protein R3349_03525 [Geminicoccaceae bacterium]|nr:hypothetical protein [Geminicoccaceae bacterium]
MGDDPQLDESVECLVDAVRVDAKSVGHARSAEEGCAAPVGGEGEQEKHCGRVGPEPRQPAVVK